MFCLTASSKPTKARSWRYIAMAGSTLYEHACYYMAYQKGNTQAIWNLPQEHTDELCNAADDQLAQATVRNCRAPQAITLQQYHRYKPDPKAFDYMLHYTKQCLQQTAVPILATAASILAPCTLFAKAALACRNTRLFPLILGYNMWTVSSSTWLAQTTPERAQEVARPIHDYMYSKLHKAIYDNPQVFDATVYSYKNLYPANKTMRWLLYNASNDQNIPVHLGNKTIHVDRQFISNNIKAALGDYVEPSPIHRYIHTTPPFHT